MPMRRVGGLVVVLCLAGPGAAQDCGWTDDFARGTAVPDARACDDGVCMWTFGYRSAEARDVFENYSQRLEACLGPHRTGDDGVNHPDSYELRAFEWDGGVLFLSLKDKAALGETLVFLRRGP